MPDMPHVAPTPDLADIPMKPVPDPSAGNGDDINEDADLPAEDVTLPTE